MPHPFDRYTDFIDVDALKAISDKPLRKSMRVNTLKATREEFIAWAKAKKWMIDDVPWCKEGFFVDREVRDEALGKDLLHVLGGVYMQEAASMLPVELLAPEPGHRVLDMSAAPGSKTTQIAAKLRGSGVVIGNDVQEKRIWSLLSNVQRCGVTNILVTRKVGQWFAGNMTESFDRVLCDAPCTAQGTARKDSDALQYCSVENIQKMHRLQQELLESAIHATNVGGRIVYSTCTLTPEENEGVILTMLNKFSDQLSILHPEEIIDCSFQKAFEDSARVQASLGQKNPLPMVRLWPQTYDTEGFFVAVLEKRAPTRDRKQGRSDTHRFPLIPKHRTKEIAARLEDWYGTSFLRDDEILLESKDQLLVLPESILSMHLPLLPYWSGLPFGKYTSHGLPRLSHEMTTLRGHEAIKQVVELPMETIKRAMQGQNIGTEMKGIDDGDILLSTRDTVLKIGRAHV